MGKSIGLLELKSIPVGIETADAVLKAANVELLTATPTCPGKYVIIICGAVGAVKSAMESGHLSGRAPHHQQRARFRPGGDRGHVGGGTHRLHRRDRDHDGFDCR